MMLDAILISKLKATSAGPDCIPYWVLKNIFILVEFYYGKLVNLSIVKSRVHIAWQTVHITPIPKISDAREPADFRPVTVSLFLQS
jgi:hypothetical protein